MPTLLSQLNFLDQKFFLCYSFFAIGQYLFTAPNTRWDGNVAELIKHLKSEKVTAMPGGHFEREKCHCFAICMNFPTNINLISEDELNDLVGFAVVRIVSA